MVLRSNARVHPRAVMVKPLHTPLADVAVVAPGQSHDTAIETNLVRGKIAQQIGLCYRLVIFDVTRTTVPNQEACD